MRFVKMQGCGNDYIYLDGFREQLPADLAALARRVSDRHFGIGSDGLIVILPPTGPGTDARMRMWNADGSESEMCGNGLRCVGKLLYESGLARREDLRVETGAGVLGLHLTVEGGRVPRVRIDMGAPRFRPEEIPVDLPGPEALDVPIAVGGAEFRMSCLSMGNPHAVIQVEGIEAFPVARHGPLIENHPLFPRRTNVEFVEVRGRHEIRLRTWERGAGETMACGTGACAAAVAGIRRGLLESPVTVRVNGGDLTIRWTPGGSVTKEGPAVTVFEGTLAD
jgi:diaminopimelate epimerase